jgi:hypothetical protein
VAALGKLHCGDGCNSNGGTGPHSPLVWPLRSSAPMLHRGSKREAQFALFCIAAKIYFAACYLETNEGKNS